MPNIFTDIISSWMERTWCPLSVLAWYVLGWTLFGSLTICCLLMLGSFEIYFTFFRSTHPRRDGVIENSGHTSWGKLNRSIWAVCSKGRYDLRLLPNETSCDGAKRKYRRASLCGVACRLYVASRTRVLIRTNGINFAKVWQWTRLLHLRICWLKS